MEAVKTMPEEQLLFHDTRYPDTRYMGSKKALLDFIWNTVKELPFHSVLDAFSGSGCVAQMFKAKGKKTIANDHLEYAYHIANATVANSNELLTQDDVSFLLKPNHRRRQFI